MRSKWSSAILYLALLLVLGGCYEFDNPVDPAAPNYQNPDTSPPAAPQNLRWDVGTYNPVTIRWDAVTGADEYLIEYYESAPPFVPLDSLSPTQSTSIDHPGLTTGDYYYRVFARNGNGSSPASNEIVVHVP